MQVIEDDDYDQRKKYIYLFNHNKEIHRISMNNNANESGRKEKDNELDMEESRDLAADSAVIWWYEYWNYELFSFGTPV